MVNPELMKYTIEELAEALNAKCEERGMRKGTDKTQWRELVVADKLGHKAHDTISSGADSDEYGSDAFDSSTGRYAEYKSKAIDDKEVRNILCEQKTKSGKRFATLTIPGVYNGAYKQSAIDAYANNDHYFSVFYKEKCVLIIQPKTTEVIRQLEENNAKRKPGKTTNLNTVTINLSDTNLYDVAYCNRDWFGDNYYNTPLYESN